MHPIILKALATGTILSLQTSSPVRKVSGLRIPKCSPKLKRKKKLALKSKKRNRK